MSTIFSKIIKGEISAHKILENEEYLAFLDVSPLATGHTLVIPKIETDYIFDLSPEKLAGLMAFAQQVAIPLRKAIPCRRIGVAVIGLEVPHAHVHLVPMNSMDDLNFTRAKMKVSAEELASTAQKITALI
jgi:histidine triad (HIT) family protein